MGVVITPHHHHNGRVKTTRECILEVLELVGTSLRGGLLRAIPFKKAKTIDITLARMVGKNGNIGTIYRVPGQGYNIVDIQKVLHQSEPLGGQSVVIEKEFRLFPKNPHFHRIYGQCSVLDLNKSGVVLAKGEKVPFQIPSLAKGQKLILLYQGSTVQWWFAQRRPGYTIVDLVKAFRFLQEKLFEFGLSGKLFVESFEARNQQNVRVMNLKGLYELPLIEDELTFRGYQEGEILNTELRFNGFINLSQFMQIAWNTKANMQSMYLFDKLVENTGEAITNLNKRFTDYGQQLAWETQANKALHKAANEQMSNVIVLHEQVFEATDKVYDQIQSLEKQIAESTAVVQTEVLDMVTAQGAVVETVAKSFNALNKKLDGSGSNGKGTNGNIITTPPSKVVPTPREPLVFKNERDYIVAESIITTVSESPGLTKNKINKKVGKSLKRSRKKIFDIMDLLAKQGILTMVERGQSHLYFMSNTTEMFK